MTDQAFFTLPEAAREMRLSAKTIERAIKSGHLKAKRSGPEGGGKHLISRAALLEWFDSLADA